MRDLVKPPIARIYHTDDRAAVTVTSLPRSSSTRLSKIDRVEYRVGEEDLRVPGAQPDSDPSVSDGPSFISLAVS